MPCRITRENIIPKRNASIPFQTVDNTVFSKCIVIVNMNLIPIRGFCPYFLRAAFHGLIANKNRIFRPVNLSIQRHLNTQHQT